MLLYSLKWSEFSIKFKSKIRLQSFTHLFTSLKITKCPPKCTHSAASSEPGWTLNTQKTKRRCRFAVLDLLEVAWLLELHLNPGIWLIVAISWIHLITLSNYALKQYVTTIVKTISTHSSTHKDAARTSRSKWGKTPTISTRSSSKSKGAILRLSR